MRLVDPTGADHEQLQENEDRGCNEAEPELPSLLRQLLAQQHLEDELETQDREDPERRSTASRFSPSWKRRTDTMVVK